MDVHYTYGMGDFEEISEAADRLNPKARRLRKAYLLLGIALVALPFLAGGSIRHPDVSLWPTIPFGVLLIMYAANSRPRKLARKYYSVAPYEYKASITEAGITTLSPTVRTELNWAAFSRCIEAENVLALVYENVMYVFPKRAFSEQQWEEFHGLIQRFLSQAR
jgi:YcxB-like protein